MANSANALADLLAADTQTRRPRRTTPPASGDTEIMAAAVDVLTTEIPDSSTPTREVEAEAVTPTPIRRTRARGGVDRVALATRLTGRIRRGATKTKSVTITIPSATDTLLAQVAAQLLTDPTLGPGVHQLNRSLLLEEAATRYMRNPAAYPAVLPELVTSQPRLAGSVGERVWLEMQDAWGADPAKAQSYGPHLAAAVREILQDLQPPTA